jgi:hypothetical protein
MNADPNVVGTGTAPSANATRPTTVTTTTSKTNRRASLVFPQLPASVIEAASANALNGTTETKSMHLIANYGVLMHDAYCNIHDLASIEPVHRDK